LTVPSREVSIDGDVTGRINRLIDRIGLTGLGGRF
jgi:hypothetical protein